jgi:hypothetical protein
VPSASAILHNRPPECIGPNRQKDVGNDKGEALGVRRRHDPSPEGA